MKLLLTSAGIRNPTIHGALLRLLGKPIEESNALLIPTGINPFPGHPQNAYRFLTGQTPNPMAELGWKSLGLLELTVLPTIKEEHWVEAVRQADALLVQGGDVFYLTHWMRESGLANLLPTLHHTVYVGISAGSITTATTFGETFDNRAQPFVIGQGLGLVDFALLPHLGQPTHPESTAAKIERMAAELPVPVYGIDDETAIVVVDGHEEVISEGHWKRFAPGRAR